MINLYSIRSDDVISLKGIINTIFAHSRLICISLRYIYSKLCMNKPMLSYLEKVFSSYLDRRGQRVKRHFKRHSTRKRAPCTDWCKTHHISYNYQEINEPKYHFCLKRSGISRPSHQTLSSHVDEKFRIEYYGVVKSPHSFELESGWVYCSSVCICPVCGEIWAVIRG